MNPRTFLKLLAGTALGWGCRGACAEASRHTVASSMRAASVFLGHAQFADGAWRSARHGCFRDADALTPTILWSLQGLPTALQPREAMSQGWAWLRTLTDVLRQQSEPWHGLQYPLFAASYGAQLWAVKGDRIRAEFWADLIEKFELKGNAGGWSDASVPPQAMAASEQPDMWNPNISATVTALEGLRRAGRQAVSLERTLAFVGACQNIAPNESDTAEWDDGGFFFTPGDPARNKAGLSGVMATSLKRYRSYGSASCDGLLCLLDCGLPITDERVTAAIQWFQQHSDPHTHAGRWPDDRKDSGRALYFYYAAAFAECLRRLEGARADLQAWLRQMRTGLSQSLIQRQRADGSWANEEPESFEDDPLLATSLALRALTLCTEDSTGSAL